MLQNWKERWQLYRHKTRRLIIFFFCLIFIHLLTINEQSVFAEENETYETTTITELTILLDQNADIEDVLTVLYEINPSFTVMTIQEIGLVHISSEEAFDMYMVLNDETIRAVSDNYGQMAELEQEAVELKDIYSDGQPILMDDIRTETNAASEESELLESLSWHVSTVTENKASLSISTGSGVEIALIDSGVDITHPILADKISLKTAKSYVTGEASLSDTNGHGTMVAGVISQIAPEAMITPYRVIGEKSGDSLWTIEAIIQAVNDGQDILNMSLGTYKCTNEVSENLTIEAFERAVSYALSNDVIVVASAGNKGINLDKTFAEEATRHLPGSIDGVITVSATGAGGAFASYSNHGSNITFAAPGGDLVFVEGMLDLGQWIYSTYPTTMDNGISALGIPQGYTFSYGTSLSAPNVTACIANILAYHQKMTGTEADLNDVLSYLQNGALDLGDLGYDIYFGDGLVNIYSSLLSVNDTMAPEGEIIDASYELHTQIEAADVVTNLADNKDAVDDLNIYFKTGYDSGLLGEQNVEVMIEDTSGNAVGVSGKITMIDTTAPTAKPYHLVVEQGQDVQARELVTDIWDNAGAEDVMARFVEEVNTSATGISNVQVKLTDQSGNEAVIDCILEVIAASQSSQPTESNPESSILETEGKKATKEKKDNRTIVEAGIPKTGDGMNILLVIGFISLQAVGIAFYIVYYRKKRL